jgi:hypothetical protein
LARQSAALARNQLAAASGARAISQAHGTAATSAGAQRAATQQLGIQFGDFTQQLSLGTPFVLAFAQQAGQRRARRLRWAAGRPRRSVLRRPWGAVVLAAGVVVGQLTGKLFENEAAAQSNLTASDALSQAQSVLGEIFDLQTGKINANTEALRINARMKAIELRADAATALKSAQKTFGEVGERGIVDRLGLLGDGILKGRSPAAIRRRQLGADRRAAQQRELLEQLRTGKVTDEQALDISEKLDDSGLSVSKKQLRKAIADRVNALEARRTADAIDRSLDTNSLAPSLRRDAPTRRPRTPPKPRDDSARVAALQEFGEDASDRIAGIAGRFAGQPKLIEQAATALRQLDDIVDDLNRKKPPNLAVLLADAERARGVIQAGVNRPYQEFLEQQGAAIANVRLLSQGREGEAQAAGIILQLEEQMGPLSTARKEAVLATVEALRAEERQLDVIRQKQEKYLEALGEVKGAITDAIGGGLDGIKDLPGRLLGAFKRLSTEVLVESLFGDTFRKLEDQVRGTKTVEDASNRMQVAVDKAAASIARLGDAAEGAASGQAGTAQADAAGAAADSANDDIVVTGNRLRDRSRSSPRQSGMWRAS